MRLAAPFCILYCLFIPRDVWNGLVDKMPANRTGQIFNVDICLVWFGLVGFMAYQPL